MSKRRFVRPPKQDLVAIVHELLDLTPVEQISDLHYQALVALDRLEDILAEFGVATDTAGNVPGLAILLPQLSVITEFILAHRAGADKLEAQR